MVEKEQFKNKEVVKHYNKAALNSSLHSQLLQIEKEFFEGTIFKKKNDPDFYFFCENKIKQQKARDTPGTSRHKESYLNKLKAFKRVLTFNDITPGFMYDYETYCKERGNKDTTIWGSVKFVKKMINAALNDGAITGNPLKGYKAPTYVGPVRKYLTEKEIESLEKFTKKSKIEKLVKVADWFLFACYTGLRYDDVRTFDKKQIVNDRIILRTGKTKSDVSIKVHPKLKLVIERMALGVISNTKMNDYLKVIGADCKINKELTFHLARHTFAVYWLDNGGTMESLRELLGHSSMRTTQIYGKVTNLK